MEESGKERDPIHHEVAEIRTMPGDGDGEEGEDKGLLLSWDAILPDELLLKVLSLLPVANIIKLGIVCKRWYEVIHSEPSSWAMMAPQKPFFLRSCSKNCAFSGSVCDPHFLRLANFGFTRSEKTFGRASSSCGLVCLMNTKDGSRLLVGNPIKSDWKLLSRVPGVCPPYYIALALSFDRRTRGYTVVVAKCPHLPGSYHRRHFSFHIYESTTQWWPRPSPKTSTYGWSERRPSYAPACSTAPTTVLYIMAFDLTKPPASFQSLIRELIHPPYPLECVGLINLSNKLVMIGRTELNSFPRSVLVILELEDKTWREVARMPLNLCLRTYTLIFCGAGDFLFMHFLKSSELLTFDMRQKVWKWSSQPPCVCPALH